MNVSVIQALQLTQNNKHIILDVRTASECAQGIPQGAMCLELSAIEDQASVKLSKSKTYYVICQTSQRSVLVIQKLKELGFDKLILINSGFQAWQQEKLPIEIPKLNDNDIRYQRHHQLRGFGRKSQEKLLDSHVLLIGAGGLGSSSALYLAAAGIGQITIIDDDIVELSNLQRQIIHRMDSIGTHKVNSAKKQMHAINPGIKINAISTRLNKHNVKQLISNVDVVIDGSDNLSTRYLVNDMCLTLSKPLVYAAVYQFEAQISVFDFRKNNTPCLRCLFPQTEGFEPTNCSIEGVLGVVPGMAGIMQACEAIKLITNVGEVLDSQLLIIDLLDNSNRRIKYTKDSHCHLH